MNRDDRFTDTIISLMGRGAPKTQGLGVRVAAELRGYWEALRNGRDLPARAQIDPRGIERALEYAFILERVAPGMGRFRLAGTHLNDLMGMEVRGMPLTAFFNAQARRHVADATEAVFSKPAIAELKLVGEGGFGKPALTACLLLLPLKSDLGDVSRALGCLVAEGSIGRVPRRFAVTGVEVTQVDAPVQNVPQPGAYALPQPVNADHLRLGSKGFEDEQAPFVPRPARPAVQPGGDMPQANVAQPAAEAPTPEQRRRLFRVISAGN